MSELDYSIDGDPVWAILNGLPSMVAYWDRNLRCRFANRAYERWFGKKGSTLFDTHIRDLLGPELFRLNEPHILAALAGQSQQFERLIPGPDGCIRPSLACYIPHVVAGKVQGFIVQVTEVTALYDARAELQRRVEECARVSEALRKTQSELQLAQHLGEIGSWTWDVDEDLVSWSPQLFEIFGLTADQPPPTLANHDALYTPSSLTKLRTHVRRAIDFGLPYTLDLQYFHRSGRMGWIEARGAALRDTAGRVVRLHGTAQEITARYIAREAGAHAEKFAELQRALAEARAPESSGFGAAHLNRQLDARLVTASASSNSDEANEKSVKSDRARADVVRARSDAARLQAVRATGQLDSADEGAFDALTSLAARLVKVPACFISIVDNTRDFYKSQQGLPSVVAKARELKGETLCHFTLGLDEALVIADTHSNELWRSVPTVESMGVRAYVGVPLKFRGQNIGSFCVVDTVPRKWSAEDLETLRELAVSASREIDLRAAVTAAQEAETAARAHAFDKERLVAVVAHDLRTPLQILQLATVLLSKDASPKSAALTARMQSALSMMRTMVDGLIHTGAVVEPTTLQPISAAALVRDAFDLMSPIAQKLSITLTLDVQHDAIVQVDYGQMLRVLSNLIGNALKYSPADSVVGIGACKAENTVQFTVSDQGIGMDESEVARAFEYGWQSASGTARGDGAGLGLAIVKSLVAQQGGAVTISSQPDVGTVVTVALPC